MIKELIKQYIKSLIDSFNKFIFILFVILFITSFFIKNFYVDLFKVIFLVLFIYRLISKNRIKRQKENQIFLNIINGLLKPFEVFINNRKDKDHIYTRCYKCRTILKLPLPDKKGFKKAKCPNCGKRVRLLALKHTKIEVIKIKKHRD